MMEDLRSPKEKARAAREYKAWGASLSHNKKRRSALRNRIWAGGAPWQPIEACPFTEWEYEQIFVTDGKVVALANVTRRFGRPMRCVKKPTMAMTDAGMAWIGGKWEEYDAPDWWFEWELEDVNGHENYAGGEPTGRDEVPFIATHWMPWPTALGSVNRKAVRKTKAKRRK